MLLLQADRSVPSSARKIIAQATSALPELVGEPIKWSLLPQLTVANGKLLSGCSERGTAVFAAAFIRQRRLVLEKDLPTRQLQMIFIHEVFHFVWARLNHRLRLTYDGILQREFKAGARTELGESSAEKKSKLLLKREAVSTRLWRDYVCESFCDTAAWMYSGQRDRHEFRMAKRWKATRRRWFLAIFESPRAC